MYVVCTCSFCSIVKEQIAKERNPMQKKRLDGLCLVMKAKAKAKKIKKAKEKLVFNHKTWITHQG
jgi:flagellar biosynthesis regulator FlaF